MADDMGYIVEQRNGQRLFGPPSNWCGEVPSHNCEVFVGNIPKEIYEDTLVPILSAVGTLYQFRLMMDFHGYNRGFGFAKYALPDEALEACRLLHGYPVVPGKKLGVVMCVDNNSLYLGKCILLYYNHN